jgi:hypothetical protein
MTEGVSVRAPGTAATFLQADVICVLFRLVSRRRKLTAAAIALAAGLVLAWPLRRRDPQAKTFLPLETSHADSVGDRIAEGASANSNVSASEGLFRPVKAIQTASVVSGSAANGLDASVLPTEDLGAPESTPTDPASVAGDDAWQRPAYATGGVDADSVAPEEPRGYRIHVVHNGDSLEKLAERYLGDATRAIELLNLNRDTLANPHLLPIGAELRIPPSEVGP